MALRVLLADESPTIKKVFQLALQDFAVDVASVNVGGDVLPVAARVRPDIIFIDVLLQKKNGYEVAREIKTNAELGQTPVVLVWSGFMDLDQEKFRASKADAHLEKPFDTEKLRNLVKGLVPKTQNHPLSSFLEFPDLPDFVESQKTTEKPVEMDAGGGFSPAPPLPPSPDNAGTWTMDSFEPLNAPENESSDEFMTVDLPSEPPRVEQTRSRIADISQPQPDDDDRQWVQKTITQFKLPKEKTYDRKPEVKYSVPEEKISAEDVVTNSQWSRSAPPPIPKATEPAPMEEELELDLSVERESAPPAIPELNEKQIEAIIRAQSKDVIERVVWQVLPEIASRIIERELERLLKEREKL